MGIWPPGCIGNSLWVATQLGKKLEVSITMEKEGKIDLGVGGGKTNKLCIVMAGLFWR